MLLVSIMIHSSFLFDWFHVVIRSIFLVLLLLFWYILLENKSKNRLVRIFAMTVAIVPLATFIFFFAIFPQAVFISNFTFNVFHLAASYPVSVTSGVVAFILFLARIIQMIITGKPWDRNLYPENVQNFWANYAHICPHLGVRTAEYGQEWAKF